eukprot:EC118871.1.p1 GENE.EC118871.1~~EC118871.1.p1  ORF type:complete len:145 (+),score=10.69 EC118871.1:72-506(+)
MIYAVAVDASSGAQEAFEYATQCFYKPGDSLVLISIADLVDHPGLKPYYLQVEQELNKQTRDKAKAILETYISTAASLGIPCRCIELTGHPGEQVCNVVDQLIKERAVTLLVGRRGIYESERQLLGSVSDFVVKNAACTVVVVR